MMWLPILLAEQASASTSEVCRGDTYLIINTFIGHYNVDLSSAEVLFSRKVVAPKYTCSKAMLAGGSGRESSSYSSALYFPDIAELQEMLGYRMENFLMSFLLAAAPTSLPCRLSA